RGGAADASDAHRNLSQDVEPVAALGSVSDPGRGDQHGADKDIHNLTHPTLLQRRRSRRTFEHHSTAGGPARHYARVARSWTPRVPRPVAPSYRAGVSRAEGTTQ